MHIYIYICISRIQLRESIGDAICYPACVESLIWPWGLLQRLLAACCCDYWGRQVTSICNAIGTWAWWCVVHIFIIDHDVSVIYREHSAVVIWDTYKGFESRASINSWGWGRLRRHWMVVPQPMCKHGCPLPLRHSHLSVFGLIVRKICVLPCYHQITHHSVTTLDPQWELVILRVVMDCCPKLLFSKMLYSKKMCTDWVISCESNLFPAICWGNLLFCHQRSWTMSTSSAQGCANLGLSHD